MFTPELGPLFRPVLQFVDVSDRFDGTIAFFGIAGIAMGQAAIRDEHGEERIVIGTIHLYGREKLVLMRRQSLKDGRV